MVDGYLDLKEVDVLFYSHGLGGEGYFLAELEFLETNAVFGIAVLVGSKVFADAFVDFLRFVVLDG